MIFEATFPEKDSADYNLTIEETQILINSIKSYANFLISIAVDFTADSFDSRIDALEQAESFMMADAEMGDSA